jgi:tRNA threonylcarbamoyladenosine biosynthesis protein TsaB
MRFAAIETSTDWCSVAVCSAGETRGIERRAGTRHSEFVLPMLQRICDSFGTSLSALDAVAFGAGPGGFTGLRIACAVAQGLALARGIPVLGVSTLEALAEASGAPRAVACLDARMREVYYSALEKRGDRFVEVIPARCVAPADAPAPPGEGWVACGNGFAAYKGIFEAKFSVMKPEIHPSAVAVARLAAPRLAAGEGVDAALAVPLYLRDKVAFTKEELARK